MNSGFVGLLAFSLVVVGCGGKVEGPAPGGGQKKGAVAAPATIAKVTMRNVPVEISVIGNVEAYAAVTVKAQVSGELLKVHFNEGDYVKKGDLLFNVDPRPLEAAVRQMEANVARDLAVQAQAEANLTRDQAQEKYVKEQADRFFRLFQQGIISKDQAEQYRTNASVVSAAVNADKAAVESARASVGAVRAGVENSKLSLAYTTIRAPMDGRTGNISVKAGNIVSANVTDLMTINQVQPIYVTFAVPESNLGSIKKYMAQGKLTVFAAPQQDEGSSEQTGTLTFVDNSVDTSTGTIKLKGTFVNAERKLWPGEFVRVRLRMTTLQNALVVPNQAVQAGQEGSYVYVVKEDRRVEQRAVTTGERIDQDLVIEKGLEDGETIVTEGHLRLAPGMQVALRGDRKGGGKGEFKKGESDKSGGEKKKEGGP
jgi:multidrug efflux system membrane fusion protein